eukprot:851705-Rhodomonas_salina.1
MDDAHAVQIPAHPPPHTRQSLHTRPRTRCTPAPVFPPLCWPTDQLGRTATPAPRLAHAVCPRDIPRDLPS